MAKGIKVVPNVAGYRALLASADVQGDARDRARAIADRANSLLDPDEGYRLDDFEVKEFEGRMTTGYVVRTKTDHARASQAKNNTLLKSLDAGRY